MPVTSISVERWQLTSCAKLPTWSLRLMMLLLFGFGLAPLAAGTVTLHVAPGGTAQGDGSQQRPWSDPQQALQHCTLLARQSPDADIEVLFAPGVYRITRPLEITPRHVPARGRLTLRAKKKGTAVLSGGTVLTNWQITDDGRWTTQLPQDIMRAGLPRELFVDGVRRPRARHPNEGYLRVVKAFPDERSGFTFKEGDLPNGYRNGGELVFLHDWSITRVPVAEVDPANRRLRVAQPIGPNARHYRIDHFEPHPRYFLENHPLFLDTPGEWLVTSDGQLTYCPLPGEKPGKSEVVIPRASALVVLRGEEDQPVTRVSIIDMELQHAAWPIPGGRYAAGQATSHETTDPGRRFVPAAVVLERAERCRIAGCRIAHLGTSGVELGSRTRQCVLEDCVLEDISGNGVNLGEDRTRKVGGRPWWQSAPEQVASGHEVRFNRIVRCGRQFFGAVAIWCGIAEKMHIHHNEIADHPYTGVSVGWMWNPTQTPARANIVADNHIHHVMQVLSDGGGIYTLGHQPGTRLVRNVIHDIPVNVGRAESNGMFLDEGSDQIEIAENTIYGTARSPLRFHRAKALHVHDNILVVPNAQVPPYRYNATDPKTIRRERDRVLVGDAFEASQITMPHTGPRR